MHECPGFAELAFGLRRLHVNASSQHQVIPSPCTCISPAFHPGQATFFALFFSFLLQVLLLRIDSLSLAITPPLNKRKKMKTLKTLEAELQEAHDALLAITKDGIFGKPRLQACGRVIEAMQAILAYKRSKLATK